MTASGSSADCALMTASGSSANCALMTASGSSADCALMTASGSSADRSSRAAPPMTSRTTAAVIVIRATLVLFRLDAMTAISPADRTPFWHVTHARDSSRAHPGTRRQSDDKRPLCRHPNSPYIGCIRHSRAMCPSFPRRREPCIPGPRRRREWERNGTKQNETGTELKVRRSWPLVTRPTKAKWVQDSAPRRSL